MQRPLGPQRRKQQRRGRSGGSGGSSGGSRKHRLLAVRALTAGFCGPSSIGSGCRGARGVHQSVSTCDRLHGGPAAVRRRAKQSSHFYAPWAAVPPSCPSWRCRPSSSSRRPGLAAPCLYASRRWARHAIRGRRNRATSGRLRRRRCRPCRVGLPQLAGGMQMPLASLGKRALHSMQRSAGASAACRVLHASARPRQQACSPHHSATRVTASVCMIAAV